MGALLNSERAVVLIGAGRDDVKDGANCTDSGGSGDRDLWKELGELAIGDSGWKPQGLLVESQGKRYAVCLAIRHGKMLNEDRRGFDRPGMANRPRPTRDQVGCIY